MAMVSNMTDEAALVTGAASGLGRGTALALARAGANVCIVDVNAAGLEETALAAAQRVAERMRRKVESGAFSFSSNAINATISVGVAEANPSMDSILDLIKVADRALYVAKESGRNRVCALDALREIGGR